MWHHLIGDSELYVWYHSLTSKTYLKKGGSSYIFKGFTFSSLENVMPRSIGRSDLINNLIKRGKVTLSILKVLKHENGLDNIDLSDSDAEADLIYSLPLQFVAIKNLRPNLYNETLFRFWDTESKFRIKHNNLIEIYDSIDVSKSGIPARHLIMEWADGVTLDNIEFNKDLDKIDFVFDQILSGVEAIHNTNNIHRDLKPKNIIVDKNLKVNVIDYALLVDVRTDTFKIDYYGTPAYSSPEQLRNESLGFETDIWALGLILYGMVFNKDAIISEKLSRLYLEQSKLRKQLENSKIKKTAVGEFNKDYNDNKYQIQKETYEIITRREPDFSFAISGDINMKRIDHIVSVIKKCLEKNSDFRYQTIVELRTAFNSYSPELNKPSIPVDIIMYTITTILLIIATIIFVL